MKKVIILHGTGRSGTTVLSNIFANHPDFAWINNYQSKFLSFPQISLLNRFVSESVDLTNKYRSRFQISGSFESYDLWKKHYPNFNHTNAQPDGEPYLLNEYLVKICFYAGKDVFLTKLTGQARAAFLEHGLREYKVVWIDRDPVAVVLSMLKQEWYFKQKPEIFAAMSLEEKLTFYANKYIEFYNSKFDIPETHRIDVKYKDLIKEPEAFFKVLTEKLEITYAKQLQKAIIAWRIQPDVPGVFQHKYTPIEMGYVTDLLQDYLPK